MRLLMAGLALACLAAPRVSCAQRFPPRILLVFDTSGSMGVDLVTGEPTGGDDSAEYPGSGGTSRLFVAKNAIATLVETTSEVEFALMRYPQLEGAIELVDVSTPLSIEHYLGAEGGGAVGLDQVPERFTDWSLVERLDARTPVEGLWLTGQDTITCGQPIVQGAGLVTAFRIAGFWRTIDYLARTAPPIVAQVVRDARLRRKGESGEVPAA